MFRPEHQLTVEVRGDDGAETALAWPVIPIAGDRTWQKFVTRRWN